ncbi:MAG: hypothetical protein ABIA04_16365 [Pseudomonadota bacterium]
MLEILASKLSDEEFIRIEQYFESRQNQPDLSASQHSSLRLTMILLAKAKLIRAEIANPIAPVDIFAQSLEALSSVASKEVIEALSFINNLTNEIIASPNSKQFLANLNIKILERHLNTFIELDASDFNKIPIKNIKMLFTSLVMIVCENKADVLEPSRVKILEIIDSLIRIKGVEILCNNSMITVFLDTLIELREAKSSKIRTLASRIETYVYCEVTTVQVLARQNGKMHDNLKSPDPDVRKGALEILGESTRSMEILRKLLQVNANRAGIEIDIESEMEFIARIRALKVAQDMRSTALLPRPKESAQTTDGEVAPTETTVREMLIQAQESEGHLLRPSDVSADLLVPSEASLTAMELTVVQRRTIGTYRRLLKARGLDVERLEDSELARISSKAKELGFTSVSDRIDFVEAEAMKVITGSAKAQEMGAGRVRK